MCIRDRGKTDWNMSHEEAMRRRHADPEAPRPYAGWEDTITVGFPEAKEQKPLSDGMQHQAFQIGLEFECGGRRWRCTDLGTRTVDVYKRQTGGWAMFVASLGILATPP